MEESVTVMDLIYGLLAIPALVIQLLIYWWILKSVQAILATLRGLRDDLAMRDSRKTGEEPPHKSWR